MSGVNMISSEINIELTNICSMDCDFCSLSDITRSKGFMPEDIFYKTVDEITTNKLTELVLPFLMGESLLHKKWFQYISYLTDNCRKSGIMTSLITNGAQLTKNNIQLLKSTKLDSIFISCQQYDESGFGCRRIKQNLNYHQYLSQIFDAVRELSLDSDIKVSVYYLNTTSSIAQRVLGKGYVDNNEKASQILVEWERKFSQWNIATYPIECDVNITQNNEKEVGLTDNFSIIFKSFTSWGDYLREDKYTIPSSKNKKYDISCSHIDGRTLAIFWDGQIGICCEDYDAEINFGNVMDTSLKEVLRSDSYNNTINRFLEGIPIMDKCKNCLNLR